MSEKNTNFIKMTITTTEGTITFLGKFRRDLEKPNWHYYEKPSGKLIHLRKEHMVVVVEDEDDIDNNDY